MTKQLDLGLGEMPDTRDLSAVPAEDWPAWFTYIRQCGGAIKANVHAGLHPLGMPLHPDAAEHPDWKHPRIPTCRTCAYAPGSFPGRCGALPLQVHGATVFLSWAACAEYQAAHPKVLDGER